MSHHTGPVKFTEREPSFVLTVKMMDNRERTTGYEPGSTLHYTIHGAAKTEPCARPADFAMPHVVSLVHASACTRNRA
jgi:hypothetical protein